MREPIFWKDRAVEYPKRYTETSLGDGYVQEAVRLAEGETEKLTVTLTNTLGYPFNNSKKAVQLSKSRNTADYTVETEVVSATGGGVGDLEISGKLLNGFQLNYTGGATSVTVNCYVRGGV